MQPPKNQIPKSADGHKRKTSYEYKCLINVLVFFIPPHCIRENSDQCVHLSVCLLSFRVRCTARKQFAIDQVVKCYIHYIFALLSIPDDSYFSRYKVVCNTVFLNTFAKKYPLPALFLSELFSRPMLSFCLEPGSIGFCTLVFRQDLTPMSKSSRFVNEQVKSKGASPP